MQIRWWKNFETALHLQNLKKYSETWVWSVQRSCQIRDRTGRVSFQKKDFTDGWKTDSGRCAYMGARNDLLSLPHWTENAQKDYDTLLKVNWSYGTNAGNFCQKHGMQIQDITMISKEIPCFIYEIIWYHMKYADPKLTIQQFDIANLYNAAGTNPIDIIKKYPGRFPSLHVKDVLKEKNQHNSHDSTILGKGVLNVKDVLALAVKNGSWLMIHWQGIPIRNRKPDGLC